MYLITFGTRPELIKLIPLINYFKKEGIQYKTLFSGQHENLIEDFYKYVDNPDFIFNDVMEHNQTLNKLTSKIIIKMDEIYNNHIFQYVIVHGDTTTAYAIALSAFNRCFKVIHLEAGLRTDNKYSPYPEELNRRMISQIADIHLCPTPLSVDNLNNEKITKNVYLVGNTIVDVYKLILNTTSISSEIQNIINKYKKYIVVTLHRRENRGDKMNLMWEQLNKLTTNYHFVYITHPALPESVKILNNMTILTPQNYENMVHLISNSYGIITDSGGIQEEAVCAMKKVLVCRDTTERPETINSGLGKLIDTNIEDNISFLDEIIDFNIIKNPYGINVCNKIHSVLMGIHS